ncbi:MAG: uroporphyrinogen decarboxylase family protein, partial [Candidatus Bathyarchaeia archaeon]
MSSEAMTSIDRINLAINLKQPDRVPTCLLVWTHPLGLAGVTTAEAFENPDLAERAFRDAYVKYGGWDHFPCPGAEIYLAHSVPAPNPYSPVFYNLKLPGVDAPAETQSLVEIVEEPPVTDEKGYDLIVEEGFWRLLSFRKYGLPGLLRLLSPQVAEKIKLYRDYWRYDMKVSFRAYLSAMQPFELFVYMRNLKNFLLDLRRRPEKIKEACDAVVDGCIEIVKRLAAPKEYSNIIEVLCHYGGGASVPGGRRLYSLKIFEELYFPYLKRMVEEFHRAGYLPILHADADWTDNLPYLRELPKGAAMIETDGVTNLFKAKEILGDRMCIWGDVPATL